MFLKNYSNCEFCQLGMGHNHKCRQLDKGGENCDFYQSFIGENKFCQLYAGKIANIVNVSEEKIPEILTVGH